MQTTSLQHRGGIVAFGESHPQHVHLQWHSLRIELRLITIKIVQITELALAS